MSVFKEADVRLIRAICQRYQDYGVRAFLAHKFETSKTQITRVAKNQMWAHVTVSVDYQLPPGIEAEFKAYYDAACRTRIRHRRDALQGRMTENTKLTDAQVRALFKRRQETGLSYSKLGRAFGYRTYRPGTFALENLVGTLQACHLYVKLNTLIRLRAIRHNSLFLLPVLQTRSMLSL